MNLSRPRRRRASSLGEPGLPPDESDLAVPVTSEVEQLGTAEAEASAIQAGTSAIQAEASATEAEASAIGAAVPVVEPEVQRVPPYGELTPVDLPVAPPTSDEPAVVTQRPADGPPEPGGSTPLVAPRPAFTGAARALTDARLAHVHLALGMFGLARAELETLAGRGWLDVPALADLAEVRWRTGDLVGAGEAADAHLQAGGEELVALCVAAEAAAAGGRAADARNLAARVLARGRNRLDDLFAGQPRGVVWPPGAGAAAQSANPVATGGLSTVDAMPAPAAPVMSGDLAEIQASLQARNLAGIATRLALLLRTRPALAPAVLAVADETLRAAPAAGEAAALHLVRGDAYRLMGRESLAAEAFQQSSRALRARPSEETL